MKQKLAVVRGFFTYLPQIQSFRAVYQGRYFDLIPLVAVTYGYINGLDCKQGRCLFPSTAEFP